MYIQNFLRIPLLLVILLTAYQSSNAAGVPEAMRQWRNAATTDNSNSTASFALGATLSGSNGIQGRLFHTGHVLDLDAYIRPAAADIGKAASLYAVIHVKNATLDGWYMLNPNKQWTAWQTTTTPVSFQQLSAITNGESIAILRGLSGLAGNFKVYLAYSTNAVLHYNAQPYQFTVASSPGEMNSLLPALTQNDIKLNGIGVGVDQVNKTLYVSLASGFDNATDFVAKFDYALDADGYSFTINNTKVNNAGTVTLKDVKYGATASLERHLYGNLVDSYKLFFTNLPVIQLAADTILDYSDSPGTFRLMSASFKQDTGVLNMGIKFRGGTARTYPKKSYGIDLGSADSWTKAQDIKLLDMRKDSDWILDAMYADQLLARNIVGHNLFRLIRPGAYQDQNGVVKGQASIRGAAVEIIQNGEWHGIYRLQEKPDRKLYDLKKIDVPEDASGKEQWRSVDFKNPDNGSVLYKAQDHLGTLQIFYSPSIVAQSFDQEYPNLKDAIRYDPLLELMNFIVNSTDQEFASGIASRVDLDSVVDWLIVLDATATTDNMDHNFMIGRNASGKFFLSTWDHDAALAMDYKGTFANWTPTTSLLVGSYKRNNLIRRLIEIPATGFNTKLKARWTALKAQGLNADSLLTILNTQVQELQKTNAQQRNKNRWPGAGAAGADDARMATLTPVNEILSPRLSVVDRTIMSLPE